MKTNETTEQQKVILWARAMSTFHPELNSLYHVPNEGRRTKSEGGKLKSLGMAAGVPDLILDVPKGVYHGCRIEMKCGKNTATREQKEWLHRMQQNGYFVAVCYGADVTISTLEKYIDLQAGEKMTGMCEKPGVPIVKEG